MMIEVVWSCICGQQFPDGQSAFLHRDGTDVHQVSPYTVIQLPTSQMPAIMIEGQEPY